MTTERKDEVLCHYCGWTGLYSELKVSSSGMYNREKVKVNTCPSCGKHHSLELLEDKEKDNGWMGNAI